MTIAYLDTSAAMKLLVAEAGSTELLAHLTGTSDRLVSSWLLHTELHCVAGRNPAVMAPAGIQILLDTVTLVDVTRGDLMAAATHTRLTSNDAIHLATALRVAADAIITYDEELASAARSAGLEVRAPGL